MRADGCRLTRASGDLEYRISDGGGGAGASLVKCRGLEAAEPGTVAGPGLMAAGRGVTAALLGGMSGVAGYGRGLYSWGSRPAGSGSMRGGAGSAEFASRACRGVGGGLALARRRALVILGVVTCLAGWGWGQGIAPGLAERDARGQPPTVEGPSVERREYEAEKGRGRWARTARDEEGREHGLGYAPGPVRARANENGIESIQASLPAAYDLRTVGKVPPVPDQGTCGSCWAVAWRNACASDLALAFIPSANHLKDDIRDCCLGGTESIICAYLGALRGPVAEALDPYNANSCLSPALVADRTIRGVDFLRGKRDGYDVGHLKRAIVDRGGVWTTMFWTSTDYNSTTFSFYGTVRAANHAVHIVGFDDRFSRLNFLNPPPGDGAFLIENSWGNAWGGECRIPGVVYPGPTERGYFWISYHDASVGRTNLVASTDTRLMERRYGWANWGWSAAAYFSGGTEAWMGVVLTAPVDDELTALGLITRSDGLPATVYFYRNPGAANPATGSLAYTESFTVASAGFHVVDLLNPVPVTAGERYSVVVRYGGTDGRDVLLMDTGLYGPVEAIRGRSYIGKASSAFWDVVDVIGKGAAWLQVYGSGKRPTPTPTPTRTVTPTPSPTSTVIPSPTQTAAPTATWTPAPTISPSPSPTGTVEPTVWPTATPGPGPSTCELTCPVCGAAVRVTLSSP